MRDLVIIGTISKLTQVSGGLLVEVAVTRPETEAVTLVRRLSGDAEAEQAQVAWYERMHAAGTELRFQCSRSAPFNAPRIDEAGPSDDLTWLVNERGTDARVARSLERAEEVLRRADSHASHEQIGTGIKREIDAVKRQL